MPKPTRGAASDGISEEQCETIRQLEREELCAGPATLLRGCGWVVISDPARRVRATVDRSGSVLAFEGPGRKPKRLTRRPCAGQAEDPISA
jgi:hypothetical protein